MTSGGGDGGASTLPISLYTYMFVHRVAHLGWLHSTTSGPNPYTHVDCHEFVPLCVDQTIIILLAEHRTCSRRVETRTTTGKGQAGAQSLFCSGVSIHRL